MIFAAESVDVHLGISVFAIVHLSPRGDGYVVYLFGFGGICAGWLALWSTGGLLAKSSGVALF